MARTGIMLASPYNQNKLEKWLLNIHPTNEPPFVLGQRKLNGERLIWRDGMLLSSEGNIVTGIPHIYETLREHFPNKTFDGEAYCHGMSRQMIHSIVSREIKLHQKLHDIKFHIFDTPTNENQIDRLKTLTKEGVDKIAWYLHVESTYKIRSHNDAFALVNAFVNEGYEGLILRHPYASYTAMSRKWMMKWKPKKEDVYKIVACIEGKGKYKGTLGAFTVEDKEGRTFNVGSLKVTDVERDNLWAIREQLPGNMAVVRYVELTEDGIPPSSVYICLVEDEDYIETED